MAYNVSATFIEESIKFDSIHPIEAYIINASLSGWNPLYYVNHNQDIFGFEMNASGNLVATDSQTYTGLKISRELIKNNISGQIDELTISVPNTDRTIESIIQNNEYLRGREVYVLSGFAKHLPSGATAKHIGVDPDRFAIIKEKMYVDSVSSNEEAVTFSCKPKFVIKNMVLPGRTFSRECFWAIRGRYKGTECDPLASINSASYPSCDGSVEQCRERRNTKRYGGFLSIPRKGLTIIS